MDETKEKIENTHHILSAVRRALMTIAFVGGAVGIILVLSYLATNVWAA